MVNLLGGMMLRCYDCKKDFDSNERPDGSAVKFVFKFLKSFEFFFVVNNCFIFLEKLFVH